MTDDKKYLKQTFEIRNCGLGPAKFISLSFIIDGEEYKDMASLYESKFGLPPKYEKLGLIYFVEDGVISPNDKVILFEFYYSATEDEDGMFYFPDGVDETTEKISLLCEYETIYGGKRSLHIKSLFPGFLFKDDVPLA
jgi:hypothetical protein